MACRRSGVRAPLSPPHDHHHPSFSLSDSLQTVRPHSWFPRTPVDDYAGNPRGNERHDLAAMPWHIGTSVPRAVRPGVVGEPQDCLSAQCHRGNCMIQAAPMPPSQEAGQRKSPALCRARAIMEVSLSCYRSVAAPGNSEARAIRGEAARHGFGHATRHHVDTIPAAPETDGLQPS